MERKILKLWSFLSLPPINNSMQVRGNDVIQVLICKSTMLLAKIIERFYGSVLTNNNKFQNRVICKRVARSKETKM